MADLSIGNAPCSWGVEFADAPSNPPWREVLRETREAGYDGIELGPVGYMPEDPQVVCEAVGALDLTIPAGVVFRPFHDPDEWETTRRDVLRTCQMLRAVSATVLVLIDSLHPQRSAVAGDSDAAARLEPLARNGLHDRLREAARIGWEEFGLRTCMHAHAGGFVEYRDELDAVLDAIDPDLLGICLDSGHSLYAGFDPVELLRQHGERVHYVHLKDLDTTVLAQAVVDRCGFYEACDRGVFCNFGRGAMDFDALGDTMREVGFTGWATVEQDRGPSVMTTALEDAIANRAFLRTIDLSVRLPGIA